MRLFEMSKFDALVNFILANCCCNQSRYDSMRIKFVALYIYKICKLVIIALLLTYFIGCVWFLLSRWNPFNYRNSFKDFVVDKVPDSSFKQLVVTCYFTLTTLSTVGYGD